MKRTTLRRTRIARGALAASIIVAIALSFVFKGDVGTLCSFCPIGLAQVAAASGSVTPLLVYAIVGAAVLAALFGRGFCGWACPTLLLPGRLAPKASHCEGTERGGVAAPIALIAAILLVSLFVGFPVFCLFCPIGLVFGFLFAALKVFTTYEATWDLVIIPLMLLVEFKFLRSWCSLFCPLGALFKLVGRFSPLRLRAKQRPGACTDEGSCGACGHACPECIPAPAIKSGADERCTLCLECARPCPGNAIEVKSGLERKSQEEEQVSA